MELTRVDYKEQIDNLIKPYVEIYVGQVPVLSIVEPENIITCDSIFFNSLPESVKKELDDLIKKYNQS